MRAMAVAVPSLIRASLVLFFFGLCDHLFGFNTIIGVITIIPICCSGSFFLYGMLAPLWKLQSPHQTLFSQPIFFLMQKLRQTNFGNRTLSVTVLSFALLYADTSDCFLSSIPHPLTGHLYFYDLISLTRFHLAASRPVRYASGGTI